MSTYISTKYKITVKQHIKEGIKLPLSSSVKRLNRLITARHSSLFMYNCALDRNAFIPG